MSERLEEMPGEEGCQAYPGTRLADFYERAGRTVCLGSDSREAALTVVGAVSPRWGPVGTGIPGYPAGSKCSGASTPLFPTGDTFTAINWLLSYSSTWKM